MKDEPREGHSGSYLVRPERDLWWNEDFLELMVRRLRLEDAESLLDVGCGLGHWTRALARVLPKLAAAVGLDAEPAWARQFTAPVGRSAVVEGDACALPFADASFDFVTCQTLLIHLEHPLRALREMRRVVRPGGVVMVAEPSNRAGMAIDTSISASWSTEKRLRRHSFYETCSAGKIALGLGDSSVGDLLPQLFSEAGFNEFSVYMSDKPSAMWPPYSSEEQQAMVVSLRADAAAGRWIWSKHEARGYFVAGGGDPGQFEAIWDEMLLEDNSVVAAIESGTFATGWASVMYLVSARVHG